MSMSEYILEMKDISKSFYGVQVLNHAHLEVKHGEVHVLLGENGAGKSTLIKILSGAYRKEEGTILIDGIEFNASSPKEALNSGISVIYQEFNLVPYLPVFENIYMGKEFMNRGILDKKKAIQESRKYLGMIGTDIDPTRLVSSLSVAQKQMVEIAKAISNDVKILILDEPTASISDKETQNLFAIVRKLKEKGIGIIYISHRLSELFEIGDRVTVMRDGQYVSTVNMKDTDMDSLTRMMVGRKVDFTKITNNALEKDKTVLDVKGVCYKNLLKDVSLTLRKGEILGIAGLVGSGRTELAKCIIGAYRTDSGEVIHNNRELKAGSVTESIKSGIVYLSEDRKDEGLILIHSAMDNIVLPNLKRFGRIVLNKSKMVQASLDYIKRLRVKTPSHLTEAKNLSGGNQQKLVIAKWVFSKADVYIFDEPTRGIDVGAREEIYNIMQELVQNGASIIMISSDLVEVLKMCDRVVVMKQGEITGVLDNDENLTQETILSYALHGGKVNE